MSGLNLSAQNFSFSLVDASANNLKPWKSSYRDSSEISQIWQLTQSDIIEKGYLALRLDSVDYDVDGVVFYINSGPQFQWVNLRQGNAKSVWLSAASVKLNQFNQKRFSPKELNRVLTDLSDLLQESGFIFAEVKLDSIQIEGNGISASLNVNPGRQFLVKEIENIGNLKISKGFLQSYYGIREGDIFSIKKFKRIPNRTVELPFAIENAPPQLILDDSLVIVKWNLHDARINSFNGIIGVMPNNSQDDRLLITGDARIALHNTLGRGEMLFLEWRRLQIRTQSLRIDAMYPYILGTSIGIDGQIDFFRKDTTFQNFRRGIGVRYNFSGTKFIRTFYEMYTSESIIRDLSSGVPEFFDTRTQFYGLASFLEEIDNRFNPRRGYTIHQKLSFGTKLIPESSLNAFLIEREVPERSLSVNLATDLMLYMPLSSRFVFHHSWRVATILNDYIFRNEVHRIGGFNSLRGFDEESIFASTYAISNVEFRVLLEQRSFLFAFVNGAFYEQKLVGSYSRDLPYGFGAGISLGTAAGILSVAYAVGARDGNGPEFRAAKIHFGFINTF